MSAQIYWVQRFGCNATVTGCNCTSPTMLTTFLFRFSDWDCTRFLWSAECLRDLAVILGDEIAHVLLQHGMEVKHIVIVVNNLI